ncbi:DUF2784 domain-containing protein [Hoyosella subflava]|uniref:Hypothetical membrane protein n=1 Tax=Hoyosella subflava (strain DSM 45089 / JCM 17490 / NBRC 109087 / DQS3-9A1) TaxID=443218 RepID=F6ENC4_HOYSD|nr:DUF2784 domain-containing protein [Hoyosella subflava]AEF40395.1 Hypothetical membrane protein [Hoyosella subflava DQS3-9A1]
MVYRIVGEATMLLHFAFIAYVMFGGFLAWRWAQTFAFHVISVVWVIGLVIVNLLGVALYCPLTYVENWARERAGQEGLDQAGFIDHYLSGVVYPQDHLGLARAVLLTCVLISWAGYFWIRTRRARVDQDTATTVHT